MGKSVAEIIIDRFLKDVDEKETMPWQRPYERYNAFNYFTKQTYRGINRLILPFGEYLTANQINTYNKEHNEDFRYQKGIEWFPVVFFKVDTKEVSRSEIEDLFPDSDLDGKGVFIGSDIRWKYFRDASGKFFKSRNVLIYRNVADRKWVRNSRGELLPSRLDTGEVEIIHEEPMKVINDYIERERIKVIWDSADTPGYYVKQDMVELNPYIKDEESWYSTAFHEFAHSTGNTRRLNRYCLCYPENLDSAEKYNLYAKEECIAEIASSLLCAECGVYDFETTGTKAYDNNVAYVQFWKKKVKDWGKEFIYIVSQADKAFNYILGDTDDLNR